MIQLKTLFPDYNRKNKWVLDVRVLWLYLNPPKKKVLLRYLFAQSVDITLNSKTLNTFLNTRYEFGEEWIILYLLTTEHTARFKFKISSREN